MLPLSLDDLLDRNGERLLLHFLKSECRVFVLLLELLALDTRPLLNDSFHDLHVFSVYALCLASFQYIVKRSRRLKSLGQIFLLN